MNTQLQPDLKQMATGEKTLELSDLEIMLKNAWTDGYRHGFKAGFELGASCAGGGQN